MVSQSFQKQKKISYWQKTNFLISSIICIIIPQSFMWKLHYTIIMNLILIKYLLFIVRWMKLKFYVRWQLSIILLSAKSAILFLKAGKRYLNKKCYIFNIRLKYLNMQKQNEKAKALCSAMQNM